MVAAVLPPASAQALLLLCISCRAPSLQPAFNHLLLTLNCCCCCTPACREERYVEIRDEMRHMLARVGWKPDFIEKSVPVLPISGWMGDNLIKQSTNMAWWKGQEVVSADNRKVQINCLLDVSTALGERALGRCA